MKKIFIALLFSLGVFACRDNDTTSNSGVDEGPFFLSSIPMDQSLNVSITSTISLLYDTEISIVNPDGITLNGVKVSASVDNRKLVLTPKLEPETFYKVEIAANSLKNAQGENGSVISFSFTTDLAFDPVRYEAENSELTGGAQIESSIEKYSGKGYVSQREGQLTFKMIAPKTDKYSLRIRYSNANSFKENDLYVNDIFIGKIAFSATSIWKTYVVENIVLNEGENKIQIKKNWGWTYYDYIDLAGQQSEVDFDLSPVISTTVTPSKEAVKVYNFLKENFGKKVISGAMANYSSGIEEATWMFDHAGKWPAMIGLDYIDHTRDWTHVDKNRLTETATKWWSEKGLVSIMWHWKDPSRLTGETNVGKTNFDVSKINDPQSEEYKAMVSDIDIIAGYLKKLQAANVPVLWRPLHEASGAWFWWGAKGSSNFKKLWILMFDRLVKYHGLNNLIWIWTSEVSNDAIDWYPGEEYVDIIGVDIYPGLNNHSSQSYAFGKLKSLSKGKKILTLSECGSMPYVDKMFEQGDIWSWCMPWYGDFTRSDSHNGINFIKSFLENERVITKDKMPDLK